MNYTPLKNNNPTTKKRKIIPLIVAFFLVISTLVGGAFVIRQRTNLTERAAEPNSCPVDGASCNWDAPIPVTGAPPVQKYNYTIRDVTTDQVVKTGSVTTTNVSFTPIAGHTYQCAVTAVNSCGVSNASVIEQTCVAPLTATPTTGPTIVVTNTPTLTPTISPTITITVTATPTATLTPTGTQSPTPTSTATPTITATPTATRTPTPTEIVIAQNQATATPTSTATPTAVAETVVQSTTAPTSVQEIPPAGSQTGMYFTALSAILLVTLLFVF